MLTDERKIRKFYLILAAISLLSIGITWLVLFLTQPVLTEPAMTVWTATIPKAQYQDKININTATIEELTYAEGIGPSTAQKIYDFLQQNGPITAISELDAINGIGEKRIEALEKIFYAA